MDEQGRLELLQRVLGAGGAADGAVALGIGDDAAVLACGGARLAWSVDTVVQGVHFRPEWLTHRQLGFKATMAALSDLAAMGARPLGVTSALVLPAALDDAALEALAGGQREACQAAGTAVVGGNLARGGELSITTGVLGVLDREPLTRAGAEPGDVLWLAGAVGLAAAGLAALERGIEASEGPLGSAVAAWRRPVAQLEAGRRAAAAAHAAVDISDGLALDAGRMAAGSGVKLVLRAEALSTPALEQAARALGAEQLALALGGGEDYALLLAAPPAAAIEGFAEMGAVEPLAPGEPALWLEQHRKRRPLPPAGFDHFAGGAG